MQNIFLTPEKKTEWNSKLKSKDPRAISFFEAIKALSSQKDSKDSNHPKLKDEGQLLLNDIVYAWLTNDQELSENSRRKLINTTRSKVPREDLGKAGDALRLCQAWDFGYDLWSAEAKSEMVELIKWNVDELLKISGGNPHAVTNNWWMITHGAILLSAITIDGEEGENGKIDLADIKNWSLLRFKAFCSQFGNAGLYHEGSGYINYTLSMLMPVALVVEKYLDSEIFTQFPNLRTSATSILLATISKSKSQQKEDENHELSAGEALQWNDAGRGATGINPILPAILISPPETKGALISVFDELIGLTVGRVYSGMYGGLPLAVALYPFGLEKKNPCGILPTYTFDRKQGLCHWRNEWADGTESVFGFYTRASHPGGHSQDDAASIRLISLGRTWICGGGQARPKAKWQSVFTHADESERPSPTACCHISSLQLRENGGVCGIDTRPSLKAYSERYIDWRSDLGFPFSLALMDMVDEHKNPPRNWLWALTFPNDLVSTVHTDNEGFTLTDENIGSLHARFLVDQPNSLSIEDIPQSTRRFSNGNVVDFPGDKTVMAAFDGRKSATVLVAMIIVPIEEETNAPTIRYHENSVLLGALKWPDLFSPAILKSVNLGRSKPNLMKYPNGD